MKWLLVGGVVVSTVGADLLQSAAMKASPPRKGLLALSVIFMAGSFFSFLKLLEVAEYSFAVPATAASIVIETVLAKLWLKEGVTTRRWIGAVSVAAGVWLIGH
jgi:uncharacterized membrane protein